MNKLKAFTLMELVIGMIICSFVTGVCYSGYLLITRQYNDYHRMKEGINSAMSLNKVLADDIQKARCLNYDNGNLILELDSVSLNYIFIDSCIIRKVNEMNDTFHFAADKINIVPLDEYKSYNPIKEIFFEITLFNESLPMRFFKKYDSVSLIELNKK